MNLPCETTVGELEVAQMFVGDKAARPHECQTGFVEYHFLTSGDESYRPLQVEIARREVARKLVPMLFSPRAFRFEAFEIELPFVAPYQGSDAPLDSRTVCRVGVLITVPSFADAEVADSVCLAAGEFPSPHSISMPDGSKREFKRTNNKVFPNAWLRVQ